ncbi:MAG: hypothetical protein A3B16_01435 [Candidatus Zambryskibacteria bacterium RIFCSPLOWO2_01_FULL_45_43]|uniref:Uncharacterized protein n=1 Tax=Candidatus Zambryskibacteria bacterium RIFCSPLOWO2_01_FULL_45_43 TaxID=1802762 RepID=A0A1G2U5T0_9BACT|nr:MAG: hypothetical protein A3B16_01435 [Candidatus Zambryskibacteria bacterium RIFCSPLOWO2_01_FULL_45_43]
MTDIRNDNDTNGKDIFNIDRNNIDNDNQNEFNSLFLTREELLGRDLAAGLDDEENLRFYLSVCRKYPEEFLRKTYSQVKQIPEKKIKKSRGALFNYLIQKHDKNNNRS